MDRIEATKLLQEIKHYLTAGNPVWDVDEIAEACDMAIEALKNEINCVKCEHYTEEETPTGIKGVCKMDTAHREDLISRQAATEMMEDGTLVVRVSGAKDVSRVLVMDTDTHVGGGLYYADKDNKPTGEWIRRKKQNKADLDNGNALYECSNCGHADLHAETQEVPYCWFCGSWMLGEDGEA